MWAYQYVLSPFKLYGTRMGGTVIFLFLYRSEKSGHMSVPFYSHVQGITPALDCFCVYKVAAKTGCLACWRTFFIFLEDLWVEGFDSAGGIVHSEMQQEVLKQYHLGVITGLAAYFLIGLVWNVFTLGHISSFHLRKQKSRHMVSCL